MSWINEIPFEESTGSLRKVYEKISGPDNNIDNVLSVHSLRPHTLTGHMSLYKNVLHHTDNKLLNWYLESIGIYVSYLNGCHYCVQHHFAGLKRLIDSDKAEKIMECIESDTLPEVFAERYLAGVRYANQLTVSPESVIEKDIDILRVAGFSDGEILEINQVVAYFNYVNRTVSGLGVNLEGDELGLSPSADDSGNWQHV